MFAAHHFMQPSPRAWAARILDGARAGDPVPVWHINRALQITGDLPTSPLTLERIERHDLEPLQIAHAAAEGRA